MAPALLLTAGLGTRLRPLTFVRAKPSVPIGGVPLVRRIVGWLKRYGVTDLVMNLHHLPATITAVVGDGSDLGATVRYSWEQPKVLGSAGGPKRALPILGREPFLIVNGDTLTDLDPTALIADHEPSGALVTLALVPNRQPRKYGGVRLDSAGRVTGFVRPGPAAEGSFHFIGVQAARAAAFEGAADDRPSNSIGDVYDRLIRQRPGAVRGFVASASFWDVGTVADYWDTSTALASGQPCHGRHARIAPTADPGRSILWDDVEVGAGAVLEDCIVVDGAIVPAGARHRRMVIAGAGPQLTATPFD
jgi:NDP-sugar pyrophosphorylase family protein